MTSRADLRAFLALAEERGHLLRVMRPVDPDTQAAALLYELERAGKVGLIENVRGREGRLGLNLLGRRDLLGAALGCAVDEIVPRFVELQDQRVPTQRVSGAAPCQEVVLNGADADLRKLPLIVHAEKDAGEYVSAGLVLATDPDTGKRNVSVNRMQLKGADKTGIRMMPPQQLGLIQAKYEARGERLPIAVAIGNHPLDLVAAATSLPFGDDELELAGALKAEPYQLAPAVTQDVEVPAYAELVLEGYVEPGVREPEGPFGDFMEFYVPVMDNHVFRLTAITHRADPILHAIHAGSSEDVNLLGPSREALILRAARATGAQVCAVRLLPTILGCAISIEQRAAGEAQAVGRAAVEAYGWLKYCIVVDHDVDVNRVDDVWWAVCTRSNPLAAITVLSGDGFPRDPSGTHVSKAIIDATIPVGQWQEFERKRAPGSDTLRIADFL